MTPQGNLNTTSMGDSSPVDAAAQQYMQPQQDTGPSPQDKATAQLDTVIGPLFEMIKQFPNVSEDIKNKVANAIGEWASAAIQSQSNPAPEQLNS